MSKLFVAMTLGAALLAGVCRAEPASEQSIRELMQLTGAGQLSAQVMAALLPNLKRMTPQVPDAFWQKFMAEVDPNELQSLVIPIYQKRFTEQDIRDIIGFYKSPAGKRLVEQLPGITQDSMKVGQQWGAQIAQRAIEKARAEAAAGEQKPAGEQKQ